VAYSTKGNGSSGWIVFQPTTAFKDYSFIYRIPPGAAAQDNYVGIRSDIAGRGTPLAIRQLSITVLP
jgi:hypothetical protein